MPNSSGNPFCRRLLLLILSTSIGEVALSADEELTEVTGNSEMDVSVLFATNRNVRSGAELGGRYGGDRGPLRYGRCTIRFTPLPGADTLAPKLPFYLPNETKRLVATEEVEQLKFWSLLSSTQAASPLNQKIVVLIHGYNFDFERACKRATELQRLLGESVSVVLFTWPSAGNPVAYSRDETNAGWSVPYLQEFLTRATTEVGSGAIALIGHSLGTRTLSRALEGLAKDSDDSGPFAELVLSAADIDTGVFKDRWSNIRPLVRRLTLYTSDSDAPLMASHQLHGYPRLGEAGEHLTILDGAETIDASGTGFFELTGHNYQYFHPLLLADLRELIQTGMGANGRELLQPRSKNGERYWVLTPPKPATEPKPPEKMI